MDSPHALSGKKAFVTGGKRRIGRGIALAFAAAGCAVGINDLDADDAAQEPLRLVRGLGLAAVNRTPRLKSLFMRHAMGGVGELPRLARGEPL